MMEPIETTDEQETPPPSAAPGPAPWACYGRVALQGRRELGTCRVQFDPATGLFRAETLCEEAPTVSWFPRNSLYEIREVSAEDARRQADAAAERRAEARRLEAERVQAAATRRAVVQGYAKALRLYVADERTADADGLARLRVAWTGDVPAKTVRDAIADALAAARLAGYSSLECAPGVVAVLGWVSRGVRAALVAFVRDVGGTVEPAAERYGDEDAEEPAGDEGDDIPVRLGVDDE